MSGRLRPILQACADGELPPNVALMRLIVAASSEGDLAAALATARSRSQGAAKVRLVRAEALHRRNPQAFALVKRIAAEAERPRGSGEAIAFWTSLFDRLGDDAPAASVALYTLGSPELLAQATGEVVTALRRWGLIGSHTRLVDLGCGQGRFVRALAPSVACVVGLDVSGRMLARSRRACAGLDNVRLLRISGRDLAPLASASADLVLAADVFPYLVEAGLAGRMIAESARVLAHGGHLAIFNYCYGGDAARDVREVRRSFAESSLAIVRCGTRDFDLWDATAYVGRRLIRP